MASAVIRLLALIALVIMPFGMVGSPALAEPASHGAMVMASLGHCDEQRSEDKAPVGKQLDCTAACTALPASDAPIPAAPLNQQTPRTIPIAKSFAGVVLEIATPPPRHG